MKEILTQLYPLIETVAPSIAKALGLNALSGAAPWALYLLSKAFGLNLNEVHQLPDIIANDPLSSEKLKELEDSFSDWFINTSKDMTRNIKLSDIEINCKIKFDNGMVQSLN